MDPLPFELIIRVPVEPERVRARAFAMHLKDRDRPAADNWVDAEKDEMAWRFANGWALQATTPEMDEAFRQVYFDAIRSQIDWHALGLVTERFLDLLGSDPASLNAYFNNFSGLWQTLMHMQRTAAANGLWERAVDIVVAWEQRTGKVAHKGAGLYYWGVNCILGGDLLRGFMLVHESLQQDAARGVAVPDTPAAAIASMNYEKPDQLAMARQWLTLLATVFVGGLLKKSGTAITVRDLRSRFLSAPQKWSRTFLLVYSLAALRHLHEHPAAYRTSEFAGQAALDLFFNVAVVIERAIGDKNPTVYVNKKKKPRMPTFIDQAEYLSKAAGLALSGSDLGEANGRFTKDFEATLSDLLDGTFKFKGGGKPTPSGRHVLIAYGIRNRGGHETEAAPAVWQRFDEVLVALVGVLALTTEHLY